ncbi:MAG: hypothetical protein C5B55_04480 [Blastocatellia bacterium]|nr:MAG: hypothetical protein C5B55_04480 [Blastocatellia bacterium]
MGCGHVQACRSSSKAVWSIGRDGPKVFSIARVIMEPHSRIIPTPYPDLNRVLEILVDSTRDLLSTNFVGAYLQGSFAVGDFDIHSDVDFIIVTVDELSDDQVDALQTMHRRVYDLTSPWAQHLEGSYFPQKVLRDYTERGKQLWYLDHGASSLIKSDHCNTIVVRRVVREKGVTMAGPPPITLVARIPVELFLAEIKEVIVDWGREIIANPKRYNNHFYQTFIVLSYCRMLHDLRTGKPGSKRAGADWAKANLEPSWSSLIDRAWLGRPDPASSVKRTADPQDFEDTLRLIRHVVEESKH